MFRSYTFDLSIYSSQLQRQHLLYCNILPQDEESTRKPSDAELKLVLTSLLSSRAVLVEEGASVSRKPEGDRKVLLNLEPAEIQRVLSEGGEAWKDALQINKES